MSDARIRDLERAAKTGDPQAAAALQRAKERRGEVRIQAGTLLGISSDGDIEPMRDGLTFVGFAASDPSPGGFVEIRIPATRGGSDVVIEGYV